MVMELPPGADKEKLESALNAHVDAITAFNQAALRFTEQVGDADRTTGRLRSVAIFVLAAALTVGTFLTLYWILESDDGASSLAAAAVVVAVLAVVGLVNPLQTVERDVVFRRWSDMILASFFLQAGHLDAGPREVRLAAKHASDDFAVLAASYGRSSSRVLDAVQSITRARDSTGSEPEAIPTAITVTAPPPQSTTALLEIVPVPLEVDGPETLTIDWIGLPVGIDLDIDAMQFVGTPDAAALGTSAVTVTVTSSALPDVSASATFEWTVTPPVTTAVTDPLESGPDATQV